ncbi:hypothetical protein C1H46_000120 [Malus baccata]|uniref:Uncharacterized protein n=1 Tax=Malus baccata TaxID=106549 RepID=A0A540NT44_MALBA|nr:hypothetical protein C1H46_000120 [Malus baccata]
MDATATALFPGSTHESSSAPFLSFTLSAGGSGDGSRSRRRGRRRLGRGQDREYRDRRHRFGDLGSVPEASNLGNQGRTETVPTIRQRSPPPPDTPTARTSSTASSRFWRSRPWPVRCLLSLLSISKRRRRERETDTFKEMNQRIFSVYVFVSHVFPMILL